MSKHNFVTDFDPINAKYKIEYSYTALYYRYILYQKVQGLWVQVDKFSSLKKAKKKYSLGTEKDIYYYEYSGKEIV
jgi:hypothetical protein